MLQKNNKNKQTFFDFVKQIDVCFTRKYHFNILITKCHIYFNILLTISLYLFVKFTSSFKVNPTPFLSVKICYFIGIIFLIDLIFIFSSFILILFKLLVILCDLSYLFSLFSDLILFYFLFLGSNFSAYFIQLPKQKNHLILSLVFIQF